MFLISFPLVVQLHFLKFYFFHFMNMNLLFMYIIYVSGACKGQTRCQTLWNWSDKQL